MRLDRRGLMLGTAAAALPGAGFAQGLLGDRPVTIVVPFPPGGSVDGVARILAQELGEQTGGTFVVENRAGGAVGAAGVMRARPDGATLLFNASIHVVVPLINRNVTFDVVNDFTHISLVADGPRLRLVARPLVAREDLRVDGAVGEVAAEIALDRGRPADAAIKSSETGTASTLVRPCSSCPRSGRKPLLRSAKR